MLLRFNNKEEFNAYFDEENHTIHRGFIATHKFSGDPPKKYPVLLKSGPSVLTVDKVFSTVNAEILEGDEKRRLETQAELRTAKALHAEEEYSMKMKEITLW